MHKIVHTNFQFDLSSYKITTIEENYWFSDKFFTKFSFPFNFELTEELIKIFGDLLDDNAKFIDTFYEVKYAFGNQLENAIFEIESQVGTLITATFRYGFDELPNFDKKLSELPLHEETITDVYAHAETIIPFTWPTVNYNYPQIITDKYDITEPTWAEFKGKINNYIAGDFLVNTYTEENFANKNIMQPVPYMLHVLKQGFLDAGFTLKGDIISNDLFLKMLLFADIDYFDLRGNVQSFLVLRSEFDSTVGIGVNYDKTLELQPNSTYKITGTICSYSKFLGFGSPEYTVSGTAINYKGTNLSGVGTSTSLKATKTVDVTFTTDSDTNPATQILDFDAFGYGEFIQPDEFIYDLKIERVLENAPSEVRQWNKVKLTEVVPDVTFGKLVTELKKWFNLEIKPINNDIYLNFLDNSINYLDSVDLSEKEVLKPRREFNKTDSFVLKFRELKGDTIFEYEKVFQNKSVVEINSNLENNLSIPIQVDILPLPQKSQLFVETAYSFESGGNQQMYVVLYNGLQSMLNTTIDTTPLLMPNIQANFHKKWFEFRLNAIRYTWDFKMYLEDLLKIDKKIFAYGRYHIVKSLDKTQLSEDLFDIQIETETLP